MSDDEEVKRINNFGEILYEYKGRRYSEESALHNGIIGQGAVLRGMIKEENIDDPKKPE